MDTVLEHLRGMSGYNKRGEELPDPRPKELKIDPEAEMPMELKVMRALRSEEWQRRMEQQGLESYEEANDFDIPEEDGEFKTIHEDESGDIVAFEEGVRRGFIEEIPQAKRDAAQKSAAAAAEHLRNENKRDRRSRSPEPSVQEVKEKIS